MKQKVGLVVEGGGMKCAYSAGILDAFLDNDINFEYCIGVSGGAGNLASYLPDRGEETCGFSRSTHGRRSISESGACSGPEIFSASNIYTGRCQTVGAQIRLILRHL